MIGFSKSAKVFYRANKSLILSSVFVVFLAGLGGIWYYQRTAPARERARIERQQKMVADIIAAGDISQCARAQGIVIEETDYEKVCKNNIALNRAKEALDISQCDTIDGDPISSHVCKEDIIYKKIIQNPDSALCASFGASDLRDFCHALYRTELAIAKNDVALCSQHKDQTRIARCKEEFFVDRLVFGRKEVPCDLFPEAARSGCVAYKNGTYPSPDNLSVCFNTNNRFFERACMNRYQANTTRHE